MSEILSRIAEKHPLSSEYAEDGRYAWPDRWADARVVFVALEAKLEAMERASVNVQRHLRALRPFDLEHGIHEQLADALAAAQEEEKE